MVKRSFGVIDNGQHSPSVGRDDSSGPAVWRPSCSCGWLGIAVITPVEIVDLQEVFQQFAKEHGIDSILPADSIFGSENDSLIQILQHVGYDPEADEQTVTIAFNKAVGALKNYDEESDGLQAIYDLTSDFPMIVEAVADQKHRAFVWRTVKAPTLRENATEIELKLRQHLVSAWESKNISLDD